MAPGENKYKSSLEKIIAEYASLHYYGRILEPLKELLPPNNLVMDKIKETKKCSALLGSQGNKGNPQGGEGRERREVKERERIPQGKCLKTKGNTHCK